MPRALPIGIVMAAVTAALTIDAANSLPQRVRSLGSAAKTSQASNADVKISSDTNGSNAMARQMPGLPSLSNKYAKSRIDVTRVANNTATTWPHVTRIER